MPRLAFFLLNSLFFLFLGHTFHLFPAVWYAPACLFLAFFSSAGILSISFPPSGMPRLTFFLLISLPRAYFLLVSSHPVCPGLLFSLPQAYFSSISSRPVCPAAHFQFSIMIKITTRIIKINKYPKSIIHIAHIQINPCLNTIHSSGRCVLPQSILALIGCFFRILCQPDSIVRKVIHGQIVL